MDTRCWLWTAGLGKNGYGRFKYDGRMVSAHRMSFLLTYGKQPDVVCHKCSVRNCVRPDHLYSGDSETNLIDILVDKLRKKAAGGDATDDSA